MKKHRINAVLWSAFLSAGLFAPIAAAQAAAVVVPGSADAGRVDRRESEPQTQIIPLPQIESKQTLPSAEAPKGSEQIKVTLTDVRIAGMTVFSTEDIKGLYKPYLGREVTLDAVWKIADLLTKHYRDNGYFLSRVVVPQQEMDGGIIGLRAIEGYVGDVQFKDALSENKIVKAWTDKLLSYKPLTSDQIENVLLGLNDLPGVNLRAIMQPMKNTEGTAGAVRLVLERKETPLATGTVSYDNYASRFLGPHEVQAQTQFVFWPTHKTTVHLLSSVPFTKVRYGGLRHEMPVFRGGTLELFGANTTASPGYTLKSYDINSYSLTIGAALNYDIIRQRQENLRTRFVLEMRNTHADVLGDRLTKDNIRAARVKVGYQNADSLGGQNSVDATLSQGLNFLGASNPGEAYLSRADARPNFTKFNLDAFRLQSVSKNWDIFAAAASQLSTTSLYSSEQFGYGGQAFGRSYDDSEIMGDYGVAASAEIRYMGLSDWNGLKIVPYPFYDVGAIWNIGDNATTQFETGSSAGAGFRLSSDFGLSGNFGFAFPLTRKADAPMYGNGCNPRFFWQVSYSF
ncbi:MAG: ShlB/FhaC/HecB family hemolysin secretion/activation protein [Bdellovibrionales bacterium]